jgi:glycine hydroxymethyltransferase
MSDFLWRESLEELAPFVSSLIKREEERQKRKLIMIPSESYAPKAVREALGSVFQNVYAEGYPRERMLEYPEELLKDMAQDLIYYRRYADRRFYKGVDYVDIIESLAARRAAQCFVKPGLPEEAIHVNVQPLAGSPANLAVFDALLEEDDIFMGLDLFEGGHLTHGSEFNQSGKRYNVVSYGVDPKTEKLDYEAIRRLARDHRPKLIIAGYTAYSWAPDWNKFRRIADEVGAYLMADIAHTAGLAIAGVYPDPVGTADVTVFTTHKTLHGPRGAVIITTDEELSRKIDNAVFPGAQGGPHINKMAGLAVAFKLAQTEQFRELQKRTVENAKALADELSRLGLRIVFGGTDTHIVLVDVSSVGAAPEEKNLYTPGIPLKGEIAARILDLAGIVVNKNTIPGDTKTVLARGIRLGTPWVTQRGLGPSDMKRIASLIHTVVTSIIPYAYEGISGVQPKGRIPYSVLARAKQDVAEIAEKAGFDLKVEESGYPHYWGYTGARGAETEEGPRLRFAKLYGWRARAFLQEVCTMNILTLKPGEKTETVALDPDGMVLGDMLLCRDERDEFNRDVYYIRTEEENGELVSWFRALGEGYIVFDREDSFRKVQGPVMIEEKERADLPDRVAKLLGERDEKPVSAGTDAAELYADHPDRFDLTLPYFVGQNSLLRKLAPGVLPKPDPERKQWKYETAEEEELKRTPLYEAHKKLGAKLVPFAGWEMPVWYSSVTEEHRAVREAAGLFDVAHMGVFEVSGPMAVEFLNIVTTNYVHWLQACESCYGFMLGPEGNVIDDLIIYCRCDGSYLLVVNAANEHKDWEWLNAVNDGTAVIDPDRPYVGVPKKVTIRNLKDPDSGEDRLVDIALQGPLSKQVLKSCTEDRNVHTTLDRLKRNGLGFIEIESIPIIVTRTGYTGEPLGFELFVHPDRVVWFWDLLLKKGGLYGLKPCGLACRDSTRIEAGLPLYGHELAGPEQLGPAEAGFGGYVKFHKTFFIGRNGRIGDELSRERQLVRWMIGKKGVRRPNPEDPVVNKNGVVIGAVTSCSIDADGNYVGLAVVGKKYTEPGTELGVFVLPSKKQDEKDKQELEPGDRVLLPVTGAVVERFMKKEQ